MTALRWMVRRLLGNPGGLFSVTKFEADFKSQGIRVGRETLYELLDHLEDAFLLQTMPIASDSEKRRQHGCAPASAPSAIILPLGQHLALHHVVLGLGNR